MGVSYKILIVDDKEQVRNFLASLFSKYGHSCETAKDGIEALEKLKKNPFDSAVIDIVNASYGWDYSYQGIVKIIS